MNISSAQSITFFKTKAAAEALVARFVADGSDPSEYGVVESKGRPGCYIIEVRDPDDGFVIGTL